MQKLSVVIITYNEERNIEDCLKSVDWAKEIIVVDSFSTDQTVKICKKYSAKIYQKEWPGYAKQKNFGIERASSSWVLSLDADERVSPELRREIEEVLSQESDIVGYYIPRRAYFLERWIKGCGWYPDYTLRLFRKDKGRFGEREVHESVEIRGKIGYLKNSLEHYTYRSLAQYLERFNRYTTLSAQEMLKKGRKFRWRRLFLHPLATFIQMYILRRGFLEGIYGFILCVLSSFSVFVKYAKLWELEQQQDIEKRK